MAYVRKTVDRWDIETNYGYGWEVEDCEYTRAEAVKRLKEYREKNRFHRISGRSPYFCREYRENSCGRFAVRLVKHRERKAV